MSAGTIRHHGVRYAVPKIVSLSPPVEAAAGLVPNRATIEDIEAALLRAPNLLARLGLNSEDGRTLDLHQLGLGHYAHAFLLPSGLVLKVTDDEDDARVCKMVMDLANGKPGLPFIEAVYRLPGDVYENETDEPFERPLFAIVMEPITPASKAGLSRTRGGEVRGRLLGEAVLYPSMEAELATDEARAFAKTIRRGVHWLAQHGVSVVDLHHGNFGYASGKRPVLIDFGHGSLQDEFIMKPIEMASNPQKPTDRDVRDVWRALGSPEVDLDELRMGIEVEQEHGGDMRQAGKVAMDHLREFPDYYTRLTKMEARAKAGLAPNGPKVFFHGTSSDEIDELRSSRYRAEDLFVTDNKDLAWLYAEEKAEPDGVPVVVHLDGSTLRRRGQLVPGLDVREPDDAWLSGDEKEWEWVYNGPLRSAIIRIEQRGGDDIVPNVRRQLSKVAIRDPLGGQTMYHGTIAKFSEFKAEYLAPGGAYGAGFYFTNDYDLAKEYSDGGEPVAAKLTMRRPWVVDLDGPYNSDSKRPFRTKGVRERLIADGYDGVLVKQGDYLEAIVYDPKQIKVVSKVTPNNKPPMPKVRAAFDECFDALMEQFPDFGDLELHQDEKAGSDNGHGSERQFGYCMDSKPIRVAFAAKTEDLPVANVRGLMAHEFGHALDYRYGDKLGKMLGQRLPEGVERRADAIAKAVFGRTIKYDGKDIQCVACQGKSVRPRRLGP